MNGLQCFSAIAVLVVFQMRMYAASPTSFSASLDNEKSFFTIQDKFNVPENVDTTEKFVPDENGKDFETSEKQKQSMIIRNKMHDVNFESLNDKDFDKTDYAVVSEQEVIEKECDINIEDYLKNSASTGKELNDFCFNNIKRFSPKDLLKNSIYHEDQRKCNTFLCVWYSDKCEQVMLKEHRFDLIDVRIKKTQVSDPVLKKCKCFYRMWNQCGCDGILKNGKKETAFKANRDDPENGIRDDFKDFRNSEINTKEHSIDAVEGSGNVEDTFKKADAKLTPLENVEEYFRNSEINTEEHSIDAVEGSENVEDTFKKADAKLTPLENVEEYSIYNTDNEVKMTKRDNLEVIKADMKSDSGYMSDQASESGNPNKPSINTRSGKTDDDGDSIVFGEDEDTPTWDKARPPPAVKADTFSRERYSDEERNCFVIRAVWFNGQCVELNSVTSCKEGEWLVLERLADEEELLKPACKPQPCDQPDELYWPSLKRCIKSSEALKKCTGKDQLVKADAFGDGFCTCDDDFGTFENSENCHRYYQQGPCKIDEVVTYDAKTGFAVCSPDLCAKLNNPTAATARGKRSHPGEAKHHIAKYGETSPEKMTSHLKVSKRDVVGSLGKNGKIRSDMFDIDDKMEKYKFDEAILDDSSQTLTRRRRQSSSRRKTTKRPTTTVATTKKPEVVKKFYAPMDGTGDCFRIGSAEPCESVDNDVYFKLDVNLHFPRCSKSSLQLFLIGGVANCKVDENNNCREEIKLAQSSEADYLLSLRKQARKKRSS